MVTGFYGETISIPPSGQGGTDSSSEEKKEAMAKEKLKRKELLKSPDEFLTLSEKVLRYLSEHTRQVKIAVIGLAVVFAAYLAGWGYLKHVNKAGQTAYNEAYEIVSDNLGPDPDVEALKRAKDLFAEVIDDYGLSKAADLALPQLAHLYALDEQYDEAIEAYRKFNDAVSHKPPYPALSALAIASIYEDKGEFDRAAAELAPVVAEEESPFKESAIYQLARLYDLAGQKDKAEALFKEFVETYPNSMFKPMAEARL